ncbi:ABC transporter permease [Dysosmobacter sp.]
MMKKRNLIYHLILILVGAYLIVPIAFTLLYSLTSGWVSLLPQGFTISFWEKLFAENPAFWASIGRSLLISVLPILLSGISVIMAMYATVLYFPRLDALINGICMVPYTLKGVVLAISVLSLYAGTNTPFANRIVMLIFVYCIVILPYIYRGIRNNLYAVNVAQLLEAAEILGASKFYAFFRIVVPNMFSGILVSALLALSSIFTDYAVVNIIAGTRYLTAQSVLYSTNKTIGGQLTSTMVIVMFSTTLLIAVISYRIEGRTRAKQANGQ